MQSPFLEKNCQKSYSSKKESRKATSDSPFENKENLPNNISIAKNLISQFESEKITNKENPEKNAHKNFLKKTKAGSLESELFEEIEQIFSDLKSLEFLAVHKNEENLNQLYSNISENVQVDKTLEKIRFTGNEKTIEDNSCLASKKPNCTQGSLLPHVESYIGEIDQTSDNLKISDLNKREEKDLNKYENEINIPKTQITHADQNYQRQLLKILFIKLEKLCQLKEENDAQFFSEGTFNVYFKNNNNSFYSENNNSLINKSNAIENLAKTNITTNFNSLNQKLDNIACNNVLNKKSYSNLFRNITEICFEKKLFCDLMNFYLKNQQETKAVELFLLNKITDFYDYEDSIFSLAEHLTRNLNKIEILFQILQFTCQSFANPLYPLFSVCLHKLVKTNFIQEAFVLKNYMLHFKLEISTLAINSLLEALGKNNRLEDATTVIKEIENTNFLHIYTNNVIPSTINFTKLSLNTGINIISYGILIKYLCRNNLIETALVYYENIKLNNLFKDEVIFNLLIDGCSKCSNLDQMRIIYKDMIQFNIKPSIVTFNSILDTYVRAKELESAWKIYEDISKVGILPDNFTFSTLFRGIRHPSQNAFLEKALEILDDLSKNNFNIDTILINVLIDSCICLKDNQNLTKIFYNTINKVYKNVNPDIITFNTFIKGCAQMNLFDEAKNAFEILLSLQETVAPNDVSFNTMIDVYVRNENINLVWDLLDLMKKYGVKPDNFTYSTIIKGINKKSNFNYGNNINNKGNKYIQEDEAELNMAFKLFENVKMHSKPDEILYNCIMDACLRFEKIDKMMEYHEEMIRENVKPSSITCGILIKAYGMKGMVDKALEVYENMKKEEVVISSITYGCLINACIKNNDLQKSFDLYQELDSSNIEMNIILYTTMIKAYSKKSNLSKVLEIFNKMKKDKNNFPNNVTYNSVIDCCIKCNNMREAESKFEDMKINKIKPDIITFSTLIKGCLKNSLLEKAIEYLHNMINLGIKPDEVVLNCLLDGCEKMNKFSQARDIFLFVRKFGVEPSMMSFSIMMKIYGKLKDFQNSKLLMEEVKLKPKNCTLIVFTCFIKTCLQTKNIQEALSVFDSLKCFGIQADQITYNTLLKGLVINKAYEHIPDIIDDSLLNYNTLCSFAIYSEAVNALDKNISKTKLTTSDIFEIRRKLALHNIYVALASSTENKNCDLLENDNYNKKSGKSEMDSNCNFINSRENNYDSNKIQGEFNTNYNSNRKNKNCRNFKKDKQHNKHFVNENFNKDNNETYTDNYDFLLNGYKNNKKHFNPNYHQNNNNNYNNNNYHNKNSTTKKFSNRQNFNLTSESNFNKNPSAMTNKDGNQNSFDIVSQNNPQSNNLFNNNNFMQESALDISGNKNEYVTNNFIYTKDEVEKSLFDKSSLEFSSSPKISSADDTQLSYLKQTENKLSELNNTENTNLNNNGANKLKERSSFYKNFANFKDISNNTNYSKNNQFNDNTKKFHNYKRESYANDIFDKIAFADNCKRTIVDSEKENYFKADQNQFKGSNSKKHQTKNSNFTYAHDIKNDKNVLWYSNAIKTQNHFSSNNQIIRKGFNLPLAANSEKVLNENNEYTLKENDENSYSKINEYNTHKPPKKNTRNFKIDGYLNNNSHNNQQVVNSKKLTRF